MHLGGKLGLCKLLHHFESTVYTDSRFLYIQRERIVCFLFVFLTNEGAYLSQYSIRPIKGDNFAIWEFWKSLCFLFNVSIGFFNKEKEKKKISKIIQSFDEFKTPSFSNPSCNPIVSNFTWYPLCTERNKQCVHLGYQQMNNL